MNFLVIFDFVVLSNGPFSALSLVSVSRYYLYLGIGLVLVSLILVSSNSGSEMRLKSAGDSKALHSRRQPAYTSTGPSFLNQKAAWALRNQKYSERHWLQDSNIPLCSYSGIPTVG